MIIINNNRIWRKIIIIYYLHGTDLQERTKEIDEMKKKQRM